MSESPPINSQTPSPERRAGGRLRFVPYRYEAEYDAIALVIGVVLGLPVPLFAILQLKGLKGETISWTPSIGQDWGDIK